MDTPGIRGKAVKIEDVAVAANVSIMTVSRALRGVDGVSEAKRLEIVDLANRLGYRPNRNASSLVGHNSTLIGISFPTLFNDVFADILEGMRPTFESAGFTTIVNTTEYDGERELAWTETVSSWRPVGMVLTGTSQLEAVRATLQRDRVPTLQVWEYTDDPIDICVGADHEAAGRQMAEAMIALGYKRPGYVGFRPGFDPRAEGRLRGLRKTFQKAGLAPLRIAQSGQVDGYRSGYDGMQKLWADAKARPDIVFFLSDHFAFGGLMACQALHISVPHELGLVGFNSLGINQVLGQKLTTVATPRRQMGTLGAKALLARIHGVQTDFSQKLDCELVYGDTTRTPLGSVA